MDEVLPQRDAVDPEQPAGRAVDELDVVAPVDDGDAARQLAQDPLEPAPAQLSALGLPLGLLQREVERGSRARRPRPGAVLVGRQWPGGPERRPGAFATEDPVAPVGDPEQVAERTRRLGCPQDQVAAVPEGVGEGVQGLLLQRGGEVDQDVAAQDQVDLGERRPLAEVVLPEDDHAPDRLADLIGAVLDREVALDEVGPDVGDGGGGVDAPPGEGDRIVVQVGGEDADVDGTGLPHELGDDQGQRVGLLAGRAARRPEAQLPPLAAGLGDEPRQDVGPEVVVEHGVTEEAGDLDQEAADE